MTQELESLMPIEPETIEQSGLAETTIEHLILKILYARGELYGQELSASIGLKFSVIQEVVESLKLQHHIQVKRSMGLGHVGSVFALTDTGRSRTRECMDNNQYCGPAPVPMQQYVELIRQQRPRDGWLTKEALAKAFRGMVISERLISQIGPAIASAGSLLLYGKPGDGKTFLIESLANLDTAPIFLPYALECQGNIVQLFDPIYHHRVEEDEPAVLTVSSSERRHDHRWVRCKRPFIVSGGELSLDMLDLRYNPTSKIYEAPFQLKANNGIYLIDDFGRQRATPAEVLNRWIVPMERHTDFLSFHSGGKMTVPFETFLVFSTNLNPADLGDEAFLRRIQYKMLLHGPAENEFIRIFESYCAARALPCSRELIKYLIDKHYKATGKPFRRCHPRDVLTHALNLLHFEKLPLSLNPAILDRAFTSCFLEEETAEAAAEVPILPVMQQSCADYWGDQLAQINTAFGTLMFAASRRDRSTGRYHDAQSVRQYGEPETLRVLHKLHTRAFNEWQSLSLDQQKRDMARYWSTPEGNAAKSTVDRNQFATHLGPANAGALELDTFEANLIAALDATLPKPAAEPPSVLLRPAPALVEKIA